MSNKTVKVVKNPFYKPYTNRPEVIEDLAKQMFREANPQAVGNQADLMKWKQANMRQTWINAAKKALSGPPGRGPLSYRRKTHKRKANRKNRRATRRH